MNTMANFVSLEGRRFAKLVRAHPVPISLIVAYLLTAVAISLGAKAIDHHIDAGLVLSVYDYLPPPVLRRLDGRAARAVERARERSERLRSRRATGESAQSEQSGSSQEQDEFRRRTTQALLEPIPWDQPVIQRLTRHVDLDFLEEDSGLPRRYFSARWVGFWHVPTAGEMDVYAAADDAVEIRLDGAVILQRNADVGLATEVTTLLLTAGSHAIEVAYEQLGGNSSLNLGWAPAGEARRPFDVAPLFPYGPNATEVGLSEWSVRLRQLAGAMWHWIPLFLAGMLLCFRTSTALIPAILLAALGIRLHFAIVAPYVWDEFRDWIPLANSISLDWATFNLPIHDGQHPSLPAYVMRAGSLLLGDTPLGYRLGSVVTGVTTIALIYLLARRWFGETAALVAAALLGFNEYHIGVSALATEKSYYLFFMIAATYFLCEFHRTSKLSAASLAGGALGLGMLCKYLTALVIPAFGIAFLLAGTWRRLQARAVLALGLTLLAVMTPDLWWNVAHRDTIGSAAANVGDHLQRVGGLGISPYPLLF